MSQLRIPILDPSEAPPGYYAVLKPTWTPDIGNICKLCDWRPHCSGNAHRCMSYELENGLKRNDACSVLFKRFPTESTSK